MVRSDCTDQCDCPGYVAIVGKPNAGKSTLLNAIMQQKLSIVTSKAQTTRHRIIAAHSEENFQCIFLDTPGVLRPVSRPVSPSSNVHLLHSQCVLLRMAWCPAESFGKDFVSQPLLFQGEVPVPGVFRPVSWPVHFSFMRKSAHLLPLAEAIILLSPSAYKCLVFMFE